MGDSSTIDELKDALALAPGDVDVLRKLIEALLDSGEVDEASDHFETLLQLAPDQHWALLLGVRTATAAGDNLRAARFKKIMRNSISDDDEFDDDDDFDDDEDWLLAPHPSHSLTESIMRSNLRLIPGGPSNDVPPWRVPTQMLADIAGLATIKRNLIEIIENAKVGNTGKHEGWLGGTLFYGPPSCGKAFCGEVVAKELEAVLWFFDFADEWSEKEFSEMVALAIDKSRSGKVVLYFDNIDAANSSFLFSFLETIDIVSSTGNLIVLAAATYPWEVDLQIVRRGRLGRVLLVLPPDAPAREIFLDQHFKGLIEISEEEINWVVTHTEGHSFGDLEALIGTALAMSSTHNETSVPVLQRDAIRKARQQVDSSSAEWLTTAGHHAIRNEQTGLYDDLIQYFRSRQKI